MKRSIYLFFVVTSIFACSGAFAQSSVLMKATAEDGILEGGSIVEGHVNEIEILSNSQGEARCAGCGVAQISDYSFLMQLSNATITLKKLLLTGEALLSVDVSYIRSGQTPFTYYKVHMENVTVTSVQESSSSEIPVFSVSFAPEKIAWQHIAQKPDGSYADPKQYGWDIAANAPWDYIFPY